MLKAPSWFHCLFVDWEAQDPHVAFQTDPSLEKIQLSPVNTILRHSTQRGNGNVFIYLLFICYQYYLS